MKARRCLTCKLALGEPKRSGRLAVRPNQARVFESSVSRPPSFFSFFARNLLVGQTIIWSVIEHEQGDENTKEVLGEKRNSW